MSIPNADWISATDPYIENSPFTIGSTITDWTAGFERISFTATGPITGHVDDPDIQEVFYQKDTDIEKTRPATALRAYNNNIAMVGLWQEHIDHERDVGGWKKFRVWDRFHVAGAGFDVYRSDFTNGANTWSLYIYTGLFWLRKDPAQVIFSWVSHYAKGSTDLKDYLDRTSFEDASDYYDTHPLELTVMREVGSSIAEQIKKVVDHGVDFVSVRPNPSTGKVELSYHIRRNLTARDTAIDLDSKSIKNYTIRPSDQFTVDRLRISFGGGWVDKFEDGLSTHADSAEQDDYNYDFPISTINNTNEMVVRANDIDNRREVEVELPYVNRRATATAHYDIGYWKDDQAEIEVSFTDWSHFNFEVGDTVPVIGGGLSGSETYLVYEKTLDADDLTGDARLIRVHYLEGKTLPQADYANALMIFRSNTLGRVQDPAVRPFDPVNSYHDDRWISEALSEYGHAYELDRGNGGPAGANPQRPIMLDDEINGWPVLHFSEAGLQLDEKLAGGTNQGFKGFDAGGAQNYTFYAALNPTAIGTPTNFHTVFDIAKTSTTRIGLGIINGNWSILNGNAWFGTQAAATGWQIVTVLFDSAGATIRINGAVLETGLSYAQRDIKTVDACIGVGSLGNTDTFTGRIDRLGLFKGLHSGSLVDAVEARLAANIGVSLP